MAALYSDTLSANKLADLATRLEQAGEAGQAALALRLADSSQPAVAVHRAVQAARVSFRLSSTPAPLRSPY